MAESSEELKALRAQNRQLKTQVDQYRTGQQFLIVRGIKLVPGHQVKYVLLYRYDTGVFSKNAHYIYKTFSLGDIQLTQSKFFKSKHQIWFTASEVGKLRQNNKFSSKSNILPYEHVKANLYKVAKERLSTALKLYQTKYKQQLSSANEV